MNEEAQVKVNQLLTKRKWIAQSSLQSLPDGNAKMGADFTPHGLEQLLKFNELIKEIRGWENVPLSGDDMLQIQLLASWADFKTNPPELPPKRDT